MCKKKLNNRQKVPPPPMDHIHRKLLLYQKKSPMNKPIHPIVKKFQISLQLVQWILFVTSKGKYESAKKYLLNS